MEGALALRDCNNSAQRFEIGVQAPRQTGDTYWSGKFGGSQPLVLGPRNTSG
ncbi:hypothetical protein [Streptomyces sp. NPDC002215]|uniref:hypothetical protein n=1 Tax=Streptomyces sp. NPDC002215 TaxID=3154412 RepID=UPI0033303418